MTGTELVSALAVAVVPVLVAELFADRRHQREHSSDKTLKEQVSQQGRKLEDQGRQLAALKTDLLAVETALAALLARDATADTRAKSRRSDPDLIKAR